MNSEKNIFDTLQEEIMQSDLPEAEKNRRLSALLKASSRKINLMLVGATGSGKSSTINALFDMSVADVGVGVDPETQEITKFDLGNLTIWDTPGLGDGVEQDRSHIEQIVRKLSETDDDGKDHDKFRVVFLNDVPVTDRKAAEAMSRGLGTIFPEADPSCYKDVSKMYYGGKEALHTLSDYDVDVGKIPQINRGMG